MTEEAPRYCLVAWLMRMVLTAVCYAAQAAGGSSHPVPGPSTTTTAVRLQSISKGADLPHMLADATVHTIELSKDVIVLEEDWLALSQPLPVIIARNVTITSAPALLRVAMLDFNWVAAKVMLLPGVTLLLKHVACARWRKYMTTFSYGMDLLVPSPEPQPGEAAALVMLESVYIAYPVCYPAATMSTFPKLMQRPAGIPGQQRSAIMQLQQCTASTLLPPSEEYDKQVQACAVDLGFDGTIMSANGMTYKGGMNFHAVHCPVLCGATVTPECIAQYGLLQCFVQLTPTFSIGNETIGSALAQLQPVTQPPADADMQAPSARHREAPTQPPGSLTQPSFGSGHGDNGATANTSAPATPQNTAGALGSSGGGAPGVPLLPWLPAVLAALGLVAAVLGLLTWRRLHHKRLGAGSGTPKHNPGGAADVVVCVAPVSGEPAARAASTSSGGPQPDLDAGHAGRPDDGHAQLSIWAVPAADSDGSQATGSTGKTGGMLRSIHLQVVTPGSQPHPGIRLSLSWGKDVQADPDRILGAGSYGRVLQGSFQGQQVAVKMMHGSKDTQWKAVRQCQQEVGVLSRCNHPNVVALLGACLTPPHVCLVMELMEQSLEHMLREQPNGALLPIDQALRIAMDIAAGLAYLHPTVVHRDLKPANVLLNASGTAKLSDFGLSRLRLSVAPTATPEAGTLPYMAPECFMPGNLVITHKADIYSFGVLLWEVLSGRAPWKGMTGLQVAMCVALQGLRLPVDVLDSTRCPCKLRKLLVDCWDEDPMRRPSADEVLKTLVLVAAAHAQHEHGGGDQPVLRTEAGSRSSGNGISEAGLVPRTLMPKPLRLMPYCGMSPTMEVENSSMLDMWLPYDMNKAFAPSSQAQTATKGSNPLPQAQTVSITPAKLESSPACTA